MSDQRLHQLMFKRDLRKELWGWSRKCSISFARIRELDELYREEPVSLAAVLCLLKTKSFRSDFRQSLATQLRKWCEDEKLRARQKYPLTPRQLACCSEAKHHVNELPRAKAQALHLRRINPAEN